MASITWSNDANPIKMTIYGYQKLMAIIFRDFEFVHGFEKLRACAREARKMHVCTPRRVFAHAHYKLGFDNAEKK